MPKIFAPGVLLGADGLNAPSPGNRAVNPITTRGRLFMSSASAATGEAPALPTFAYEAEAATLFAAQTVPAPAQRKYTYNRWYARLKAGGIYSKISAAWHLGAATEQQASLNLLGNAAYNLTKAGSPVLVANDGQTSSSTSDYWNSHWQPATGDVALDDFHIAFYSKSTAISDNPDIGLITGGNGVSITTRATSSRPRFRANGAEFIATTVGTTTHDGSGFYQVCVSGGTANVYRNGLLLVSTAYTPTSLLAQDLYILAANGAAGVGGRKGAFASVGRSMTAAEAKEYYGAVETLVYISYFGDLNIHDAGYGPNQVTADLVCYGATAGSVLAAYEAIRQGKTAIVVGGWRDRHIGGMSARGLGAVDMTNHAAIGGLPRLLITKNNLFYARADTTFTFEPRVFEGSLRSLCDSTRVGGLDIPIYWSAGVIRVQKNGSVIANFDTADGRRFAGSQFIDSSYEGDLLAVAGAGYTVGREAAGADFEVMNGYRGVATANNSDKHQFRIDSTYYNVDPYQTPGVPASGLIAGVVADPGLPVGSADGEVQAMNFRLTTSNTAVRRAGLFPKPDGYSISTYEKTLRLLGALNAAGKVYGTDFQLSHFILNAGIYNSQVFDINAEGGQSTDDFGGDFKSYVGATYAAREVIWKRTENYVRGLLYTYQQGRTVEGDTRIQAAMETNFQNIGLDRLHYTDPHPNDTMHWPSQLYVREARRLVGDYVHTANDINAADGTTPRRTTTVAVASYAMDSHHIRAFADLSTGTPRIWNEGNFQDTTSGSVDHLSPVPYEVMLPKRGEVSNLLVTFCVSATHAAFGSIRMEMTAATLGQSAGMAACIAIADGVAVQDVDYEGRLRPALLASATLSGEVAPVLPQLN